MTRHALPTVVLIPLLIVAVVISSSACGTLVNFSGGRKGPLPATSLEGPERPPTAYGGVFWNLEFMVDPDKPIVGKAILFPIWLVDIGLSAGLDTLTLPIVIWMNAKRAYERAIGNEPEKATVRLPLPPIEEEPKIENIGLHAQTGAERILSVTQPGR